MFSAFIHTFARRLAPVARTAVAMLIAACPVALICVNAAPQAPQGATFKSGVSLVSLDFQVLGRDGRPIPDLKADEVTLRIGGRQRPIESLNLIDVASGAGGAPVSPLPPPYGSNIPSGGSRSFILVVDDDSFRVGTERALREAANAFLDGLAPSDRIALVTMPYGGTRVDMTADQERVRASLAQIVGQAATSETADEMACRSRRSLDSLAGLMQGLIDSPSPVTVAYFSASMVGPNEQVIRDKQTVGTCALMPDSWQRVGAATAAAGARLYIIEPVGFANQIAGLDNLAGVTGGVRLHLGGSEENAFTRILRETSAYYRVAFEPEASQRNGGSHRVELRVTRPDAVVRVRPNVYIAKGDASARTPRDMLRQAAAFRDLPLRATAFTSREAGQKNLKVVMLAEPHDGSIALASAIAGLFDANGKMVAQASFDQAQLKGGMAVAAMLAPAGAYRLRFAATDASGRSGAVDEMVDVELRQAGSLQLSALVLGLSRGGFVPRLQFGAEPVALAYLEIYNGKPGQQVSATFEIARTLNGPAIVTVPGALAAVGDHHSATAAIPIGGLSPGDYIVRATVGSAGEATTRVERTLRKVVP
jgi:VWFA-related protein